jgi:hypothetical protein
MMSYKVNVNRKDGNRVELLEIHRAVTPWINAELKVEIGGRPVRVSVTGTQSFKSKRDTPTVRTLDIVNAREL